MSKFSVKKPYTVLVAVIMVIVLGIVSFTRMSADLLPSINLPYVIVMTTYVGASPETVETVVTKPVESAMATISNIENISSVSNENYSMVIMEFEQSTNMDSASLEIRESLDQIKSYWDDSVGNPIIMKLNPDMLPIMVAAVGVEGMSDTEVSEYTEEKVVPRLESIEGVASASAVGLIEESVHVVIRQEKIDAINEQVFGSIDKDLDEAQQEINDGRADLADGEKEIADNLQKIAENEQDLIDAKKEIEDGKAEIADKEGELEEGKEDLEEKKKEATEKIAEGVKELNSKKRMLDETVKKVEEQLDAMGGIPVDDAITGTNIQITNLENVGEINETTYNPIATSLSITIPSSCTTDAEKVQYVQNAVSEMLQQAKLALKGLETYKNKESLYAQIDSGMAELTKGQIEAAAGFGSADATIAFGETQLESAKKQLESSEDQLTSGQEQIDSAKEQIDSAKEQLADAREQLADAQKQLDDSRDMAYSNADMNGILTVETVKSLLTAQNFSMPAGYVTEDGTEYLIRVGDKPDDVEKLKAMPLLNMNMDGVDIITLDDVADVFLTDNSADIYTNVNGAPGVLLQMQKQTGYSTGDVSDKILDEFNEMTKENENLILITLMDQGIYIDLVMDSIINNILFGAVLAILILILFLKDLRPTFIIAVSIPISLVTAIVCMYFSGVTLNIISLSGLALGIGMLVDNSIVVIENIYRLRNEGASMKDAAIEGAKEVSGAIAASTLTTVCVFAPIVFTEGITRQLFADMGLTIGYSLLASLAIALTVVPAMASKVLRTVKETKESGVFYHLSRAYEKSIAFVLKWKAVVIPAVLVLFVLSGVLAISRGIAFMPSMDSTQISITLETKEDSKLEETAAVSDEIIDRIRKIEDVQDVGAMAGGSDVSIMMGGSSNITNQVSMYVTLKEDKTHSAKEIGKMIEEATADMEDITLDIQTEEMDVSALGGSGIAIQVRGRDLDTLQEIATEVADIIESVEGTTEVSDGMEETTGELRVLIDRDKAIEYGLTVAQVFQQINAKLTEDTGSTQLVTDTKEYDILVIHQANENMQRNDLKNLMIDYTDKDDKKCKVPLSEIASFEEKEGLNSINRDSQTRYISVSASIAEGYNVGLVAEDINKALEDYELPAGYDLVFDGENEMILNAMEQLMLMMALAIIFMFLIMVAEFQSLLSPFIILFTIPLAFTGGLLGLYVTGSEVSVISLIGFVMLAGIIVNNGIVLVDYINQLREAGMEKKEAIMTAGRTRLRPVLMTALTTILAMSTMLFSHDMGADMSKPMAIVIVGGLLYGTLLTLYIVPCIYDLFNREKKKNSEITE
ncbi:MAG: efflux RND transporter permease subunit [Lachnospiraceae bacterium]|nr:efflux RND transporter permease subunit [Lachnospiraceae bacterium]